VDLVIASSIANVHKVGPGGVNAPLSIIAVVHTQHTPPNLTTINYYCRTKEEKKNPCFVCETYVSGLDVIQERPCGGVVNANVVVLRRREKQIPSPTEKSTKHTI